MKDDKSYGWDDSDDLDDALESVFSKHNSTVIGVFVIIFIMSIVVIAFVAPQFLPHFK